MRSPGAALIARQGWFKPPGVPIIDWGSAPRGLRICAPLVAGFPEITGKVALIGTGANPQLGISPFGQGMLLNGIGNQFVQYGPGLNPQVFSWEILFVVTASALSGTMAIISNGGSTTPALSSVFPTAWQFTVYDASVTAHTLNAGNFTAGELQSLVLTSDGTTTTAYANGVLANSLALGALFNYGSSNASIFIGSNGSGTWSTAVVLMTNYADVAWTAAEVLQRYLNPWAGLIFPGDRIFEMIAAAAISDTIFAQACL